MSKELPSPEANQLPINRGLPRKLYLRGIVLWALLLAIFPAWTGQSYSRGGGSWYRSGAFGLQGGVDIIDFVQQAPIWRPPSDFGVGGSVRWPWEPRSGSHIEFAWDALAVEFSLGLIVLGVAANRIARYYRLPPDLIVTLGWSIAPGLAAALIAVVVLGLVTMGAVFEDVGIRALLGLGLVAGVVKGAKKFDSQHGTATEEPGQTPFQAAAFAWPALGGLLAACLAMAVAWMASWFRGPVSNFEFVRNQWPIDVAAVLVLWGISFVVARELRNCHMPRGLTAGLLITSVALGLTFNYWDPTFPSRTG